MTKIVSNFIGLLKQASSFSFVKPKKVPVTFKDGLYISPPAPRCDLSFDMPITSSLLHQLEEFKSSEEIQKAQDIEITIRANRTFLHQCSCTPVGLRESLTVNVAVELVAENVEITDIKILNGENSD